jgi:hypothetical protein
MKILKQTAQPGILQHYDINRRWLVTGTTAANIKVTILLDLLDWIISSFPVAQACECCFSDKEEIVPLYMQILGIRDGQTGKILINGALR